MVTRNRGLVRQAAFMQSLAIMTTVNHSERTFYACEMVTAALILRYKHSPEEQ
jgi:hypothetical protein